jgi:hypothetical protein
MPEIEYLDPSIANEGVHVDKWSPGNWADAPSGDDEWQPDVDPPRITDYAAFKKHKHYGKYFKPYRYRPFPAWMYHATQEPREVKSREEVIALGPDWSPTPPNIKRIDMTGKATQGKSETQRLAEVVAAALSAKAAPVAGGFDATAIAATVAAVMAALGKSAPVQVAGVADEEMLGGEVQTVDAEVERTALIEMAEKDGVKIDKRWSNDRIKKELGLD